MANPSKMFELIRLYPNLSADPATGKRGEIYYNTSSNTLRMCIDELLPTWTDLGASISSTFQDRNALLIDGGEWAHTTSPTTLAWNAAAFIQIPGMNNSSNEIAPASFTLGLNEVLYVDINRVNNVPTLLTVAQGNINTVVLNQNRFIIARNVSGIMVIGDRLSLTENEKGSLNSLRTNFETQNNNLKIIGGGVLSNNVGSGTPTSMYTNTGGPVIFLGFDAGLTFRAGARIISPVTASVNEVKLMIASNNAGANPAGTIRCDVYSDSAGFPGALLGSSDAMPLAGIATSAAMFTFSFTTPIPTTGGQAYHYILNPTGITANGNNLNIYLASPTDVDPNNIAIFSTGGPWQSYNGDVRIDIAGLAAGGNAFAWSQPAYVQVAGQSLVSNRIPAGQEDLDTGEIAYVQINRFDVATDLTVVVQPITDALPLDSYILAYNDGTQIWLWNGERLLTGQSKQAGESVSTAVLSTLAMSSYSDETGQLRLLPSNPASNITLMTPANKADIKGQLRSLSGNNLDVYIPGYRINWQTGTVYDYATGMVSQGTFTLPTTTIPAGQSRWYSITLVKTTIDANNRQLYTFAILNSTSATTRAPYTAGGIQVGQVFLTNTAGTIAAVNYADMIQNALGGGSGGGGVEAKQMTLANNQAVAADITDALVSSADNRGFILDYYITRRHVTTGGLVDSAFEVNAADGNKFNSAVYSVSGQPDGKFYVGGNFQNYAGTANRSRFVRLNADGTTDTSFCANAVDGAKFSAVVYATAVQSDGKILVGGSFTSYAGTSNQSYLVRLNADGTLDTAFMVNAVNGLKINSTVWCIAVQADGKILIGGEFTSYAGTSNRNRLVRLNADGTTDTTFCSNAVDGNKFGNTVKSVAVNSAGKIIVGGQWTAYGGTANRSYLIVLNSDGTTDTTFATNGIDSKFNNSVYAVAVSSDGKFYAGGIFTDYGGVTNRNRFVRLNSDGTVDVTFTAAASDSNKFSSTIYTIATQSDNKPLVGGGYSNYAGTGGRNEFVRLNVDGSLDTTFTANASDSSKFNGGEIDSIFPMVDGSVICGGGFLSYGGTSQRNSVAKLAGDIVVNAQATGSINGLYRPATSTWEMGAETYAGDLTGIDFSITAAGQVQYTSTNLTGTLIESFIRFLLNKI